MLMNTKILHFTNHVFSQARKKVVFIIFHRKLIDNSFHKPARYFHVLRKKISFHDVNESKSRAV